MSWDCMSFSSSSRRRSTSSRTGSVFGNLFAKLSTSALMCDAAAVHTHSNRGFVEKCNVLYTLVWNVTIDKILKGWNFNSTSLLWSHTYQRLVCDRTSDAAKSRLEFWTFLSSWRNSYTDRSTSYCVFCQTCRQWTFFYKYANNIQLNPVASRRKAVILFCTIVSDVLARSVMTGDWPVAQTCKFCLSFE